MGLRDKILEYGLTESEYEDALKEAYEKTNGISDLDWQDIVDKYDIKLNDTRINRDTLRKASQTIFGGAFVSEYMKEKFAKQSNSSQDNYITELENKKREAKLEVIKLRDKLREMNKMDYAQARFENLKDVMIEEIKKLNELKIKTYKPINQTNDFVVASLMISDVHLGLEIHNDFNDYNIEIAKDRLDTLKAKTIAYCVTHNVSKLNIELLGDLVSGHIHTSLRVQQEEDAISNIMTLCEIMTNFINDIKEYVSDITVYSVYGNHGRLLPNKKDSVNIENVERLIPFYLRARLEDTVKVIDSKNDFIEINIQGRKVIITHGDKDNIGNALNNYIRVLGYVPDEIHMGHLHTTQTKDDCDTEIIVNGSVVSTDDYALSIRKVTKPSQLLRIYFGNDVCQYKITL